MNTNREYTYEQVACAITYLTANYQEQPPLSQLAETVNLSEFHFQRLFTEWAGVSPKKFSQYLTLEHAKAQLRNGAPLAVAAQDAGLSGTGRLHDLFVTIEGITPGQFKQAGLGLVLTYGTFESPFGTYVLGVINEKIALLQFVAGNVPDALIQSEMLVAATWPEARLVHDSAAIRHIADQVFPVGDPTTRPQQRLSVFLRGSAFQLKVWEALLKIPEGRLVSYDQIAEAIGQPTASRAVGTAIGSNPIGYLIPCHRVIKKTGLFGGYRWGAGRKRAILGWEAARVNG